MNKLGLVVLLFCVILFIVLVKIDNGMAIDVVDDLNRVQNDIANKVNDFIDEIMMDEIANEIKGNKAWFYQQTPSDNGKLMVYFIDVGQGDSTLIVNAGQTMFVYGGEKEYGDEIVLFLSKLGIVSLDYLVATHPRSDHIGGLQTVLDEIEVECVLMPQVIHTNKTFENFIVELEESGAEVIIPKVNDEFYIGDGTFKVIAPQNSEYEDLNDYSIAGIYSYDEIDILLTCDMTTISEYEVLEDNIEVDVEVLRLAHHDSNSSASEEWLKAVNPEYIIISVGKDNDYNLPNENVLLRLRKLMIPYLRTDETGIIIMSSDGVTYEFKY